MSATFDSALPPPDPPDPFDDEETPKLPLWILEDAAEAFAEKRSWEAAAQAVRWNVRLLKRAARRDPRFEKLVAQIQRERELLAEGETVQNFRRHMRADDPKISLEASIHLSIYLNWRRRLETRIHLADEENRTKIRTEEIRADAKKEVAAIDAASQKEREQIKAASKKECEQIKAESKKECKRLDCASKEKIAEFKSALGPRVKGQVQIGPDGEKYDENGYHLGSDGFRDEMTPEEAAEFERRCWISQQNTAQWAAQQVARGEASVFLYGGCHKMGGVWPDETDTPMLICQDHTIPPKDGKKWVFWVMTDPPPVADLENGPFLKPPGCRPPTCPTKPEAEVAC